MLFFKKGESTFAGKDEHLFQQHFNVISCNQKGAKGIQLGFYLVRQFFFWRFSCLFSCFICSVVQ